MTCKQKATLYVILGWLGTIGFVALCLVSKIFIAVVAVTAFGFLICMFIWYISTNIWKELVQNCEKKNIN